MPDFIIYAYIAALLVAAISGPLGSFVVWQGASFWGHTLSHSALIGVALALFIGIDPVWGILIISFLFSFLLTFLDRHKGTSRETWMAFLAHGSLALSLVFISLFPEAQRYILAYLFGDILALSLEDLVILGTICFITAAVLLFLWNPLLRTTLHEGIAKIEGIPVYWVRVLFMILVASIMSVSIKVLGGLLMTSMLIIPSVTARRFASSPEMMAFLASFVGILSVIMGMEGAQYFDTPPAASIVVASLILFSFSQLICWRRLS